MTSLSPPRIRCLAAVLEFLLVTFSSPLTKLSRELYSPSDSYMLLLRSPASPFSMQSLATLGLLAGMAAAETVHGVVVFTRHGDRESIPTTNLYLEKGSQR